MVRLKVPGADIYNEADTMFQFHNGSIKSLLISQIRSTVHPVSIPQWFD